MTTQNLYWINEAVKLAQHNVLYQAGGPFGCIIVKDKQIIGVGTNKVTSLKDPYCSCRNISYS
jgi:tRNA(Arg) A34 adenosine deaminase TadA